jgi:RNase P/RNase MRP subunit p30
MIASAVSRTDVDVVLFDADPAIDLANAMRTRSVMLDPAHRDAGSLRAQ